MTDNEPLGLPRQSIAAAREWARAAVAGIEPLIDLLMLNTGNDEVRLAYVRHSLRLLAVVKEVERGLIEGLDAEHFGRLQSEMQRCVKALKDIQRTQHVNPHGDTPGLQPGRGDAPSAPEL